MARPLAASPIGELRSRIISAGVLAPAVLAIAYGGGPLFDLLIITVAALCGREWVRLVGPEAGRLVAELSIGFLIAVLVVTRVAGVLPGALLLAVLSIALHLIVAARLPGRPLIALGVPYIGAGTMALLWLRHQPADGQCLTLWVLLVVWATDSGGYVVGRMIGGAKLAPRVSPNKTWAGAYGAIAAAGVLGVIVAWLCGARLPWFAGLVAIVLAVVAQAGDLWESAVKRRFGAKDSGALIPGHGGILDRVDGVIAAAPILAVFHATLGGMIVWW